MSTKLVRRMKAHLVVDLAVDTEGEIVGSEIM